MSSVELRKYLMKMVKSLSNTTTETRTAQQVKKQHQLNSSIDDINKAIDRYAQINNVSLDQKDALEYLKEQLKESIPKEFLPSEDGVQRTNLSFNEILEIRRKAGVKQELISKKGGKYTAYVLQDRGGSAVIEDGMPIDLKDIIQLGHDESIITIQMEAHLIKLKRYYGRIKEDRIKSKKKDQDLKLLGAFINILETSISLSNSIDNTPFLEELLGKSSIKEVQSTKNIVSESIKALMRNGGELKVDISAQPNLEIIRKTGPKGVTWEVQIDNNLKGSISNGIKSIALDGMLHLLQQQLSLRRIGSQRSFIIDDKAFGSLAKPLSSMNKNFYEVFNSNSWITQGGSITPLEDAKYRLMEALDPKLKGKLPTLKGGAAETVTSSKIKILSTSIKVPKTKKVQSIKDRASLTLRNLKGQFTSLTGIESLIRAALPQTLLKNMRRPNLQERTGRFRGSVELKGLSRARDGSIDAFLSYMRYPYATFERDGRQGSKGYYPSRLIDQSVRELASSLVRERMRVIVK